LTATTEHARPLPQANLAQTCPATLAELPTTTIDEQFLLEVARLAVAADEIAQGGASALDGLGENLPDRLGELQVACPGNGPGGTTRIDAGGEQRFASVDVADAHHHGVVHDERLDRHAAPARQAKQPVTIEIVAQRLRPQAGEQHMIERIFAPEQRAEAAWVGVAQGHAR